MRSILLIGVAAAVLAGCAGGGGSGTTLKEGPSVPGFEFTQESGVSEGETIDRRFTCDGENVSPTLAWTGVPDETKELALAVDDPDAPGGTFTHWLAYGLDPSTSELPRRWQHGGMDWLRATLPPRQERLRRHGLRRTVSSKRRGAPLRIPTARAPCAGRARGRREPRGVRRRGRAARARRSASDRSLRSSVGRERRGDDRPRVRIAQWLRELRRPR
jgi:Phosphatidylethanolamine-binding protein